MFNLNNLLVSECIFKLVCFCESCRQSGICLTQSVFAEKLGTDWYWYGSSLRFF